MQGTSREKSWYDLRHLETESDLTLDVLVIAEEACLTIRQYVIPI